MKTFILRDDSKGNLSQRLKCPKKSRYLTFSCPSNASISLFYLRRVTTAILQPTSLKYCECGETQVRRGEFKLDSNYLVLRHWSSVQSLVVTVDRWDEEESYQELDHVHCWYCELLAFIFCLGKPETRSHLR